MKDERERTGAASGGAGSGGAGSGGVGSGGTTPPSERILRGLADFLTRRWRVALILAAGAYVVLWILGGVYTIDNGSTAVLRRFGAVTNAGVEPGIHLRLPDGIESVTPFPSGEVFRREVQGPNETRLDIITGDENIVATGLVAQYKVTDVAAFLYGAEAAEELVPYTIRTALLETAGSMRVDDLLTTGKARIQNEVRAAAQELLREYGTGISLLAVTIQSIEPPTEAAAAFRGVQDARNDSVRTITDSRMLADHLLSLTRAEAAQLVEEAQAEAESRVAEARGAAERFLALLERHRASPIQTEQELLRGNLSKLLPKTETIILAPGDRGRQIDVHLRGRSSR